MFSRVGRTCKLPRKKHQDSNASLPSGRRTGCRVCVWSQWVNDWIWSVWRLHCFLPEVPGVRYDEEQVGSGVGKADARDSRRPSRQQRRVAVGWLGLWDRSPWHQLYPRAATMSKADDTPRAEGLWAQDHSTYTDAWKESLKQHEGHEWRQLRLNL